MKRATKGIIAILGRGARRARLLAARDAAAFVRTSFLCAALEVGLIDALSEGTRDVDDLCAALGVEADARPIFEAFIAVGSELRELRTSGSSPARVGLRGIRSRTLATRLAADDNGVTALYRSFSAYQFDTYRGLSDRLQGGAKRTDLADHAGLIARVSLAAEPAASSWLRSVAGETAPRTLLEIGCGEGGYLRHVARASAALTGLAIEIDADVAAVARKNLVVAGLADRFDVETGDIRSRMGSLAREGRRFDLITMTNNIYYFAPDERDRLFADLRTLLTERGMLVITTMLARGSIAAAHLDLMLRSQVQPAGLPTETSVLAGLGSAAYSAIEVERLLPFEPYVGFRARR